MRKEVLYAIIFGIILGSVILFGINLANKSVANLSTSNPTPNKQDLPITPTPINSPKSLEIITPSNHAVITDKTINISGTATPDSNLTIVTELDDLIIQSSPEGTFSAQINLTGGENTISVTSIKPDNSTENQTITVIQSATQPE